MRRIKANSEGVVIGSGTTEEKKFQILNFMNLLYNSIIEDKDYSYNGGSNISIWADNLIFEVKRLEEANPHKYVSIDTQVCFLVYSIETNLRHLGKDATADYKMNVKKLCVTIWEDLLSNLTKLYNLKYELV